MFSVRIITRVLFLGGLTAFYGCAADKDRIALETQLRKKEQIIRDLQQKIETAESMLADQDHELAAARSMYPQAESDSPVMQASASSEVQAAWASVASIQIHPLLSGLLIDDSEPTVNLIVQPLDSDGEVVKVAGELTITIASVDSSGESQRLTRQQFTISDSRSLWSRSLVASGFHLKITLPEAPETLTELLATVELNLGVDRSYTDSQLLR